MGTRRHRLPRWIGSAAIAALAAGLVLAATSSAQYGIYPTYPPYSNNPPPSGSSGSGGSTSTKKPAKKITIKGSYGSYKYKPKSVTVKKGSTIRWSWSSDAPHNVTFGKKKHSKTAMSVKSFKLTFKKKGTFHYMCTVHGFKGTVVVN